VGRTKYFATFPKYGMRITSLSHTALTILLILAIEACKESKPSVENSHPEGEKLARSYCASCHAFPDPALLD
jgi:cytochrome c2